MTYKEWMNKVDRHVQEITGGISVHDLADFLSYDAFESGADPYETAMEALENDDLGQMFLESEGLL